jgi:hypothetical protein
MNKSTSLLLSTAYLPTIEYFVYLVNAHSIFIEKEESYIKQTYRNRCEIYSANGKISLIIPVTKTNGNHTVIKDIKIDNSVKWQLSHWRTIVSAYNHSPYFLFYKDVFEKFYFTKYKYLIDFNSYLLAESLKLLKWNQALYYTENYVKSNSGNLIDYRYSISPKKSSEIEQIPYNQVFNEKFGYIPNLSIVDLIFNLGSESLGYLKHIKV